MCSVGRPRAYAIARNDSCSITPSKVLEIFNLISPRFLFFHWLFFTQKLLFLYPHKDITRIPFYRTHKCWILLRLKTTPVWYPETCPGHLKQMKKWKKKPFGLADSRLTRGSQKDSAARGFCTWTGWSPSEELKGFFLCASVSLEMKCQRFLCPSEIAGQ